MKRNIKILALIISFLFPSISPANATLDALVNLDNPRVVPILGAMNESRPSPWAHCSGYLYSSRIVFSAALCSEIERTFTSDILPSEQ